MSGVLVGNTPIISRRFGTSEIVKVMVGDEQIWPPTKLVIFVTSQLYTTNSGTLPSHQVDDVLVIVAAASGNVAPSLPTGWTGAYVSPSADFSMAVRVGYKIATAASTPSGTWSGANWMCAYVFRNADKTKPIGAIASINTASNTVGRAPGLTLENNKGEAAVVACFMNNGTSGSFGSNTQPVGWQMKNRNARVVSNEKIDTRSVGATAETLVGGGSVNWRGTTFEILPPAPVDPNPPYLYDCTSVASAGYVVDFTVLDGWPPGDIEEGYMFRCSTQTGYDGYVGRNFQRTFRSTAYSSFDCTLEDVGNVVGKERKTISFKCYPRA
jgi:hypothetical protein